MRCCEFSNSVAYPFAERGLNEAFSLAVGLWRVGLGPEVLDVEIAAGFGEGPGAIAGAVVGHDAGDADAEGVEVGDGATARTMSSRPLGVRRALLWVSIRFAPPRITDVWRHQLRKADRMDNLL